jgi:hypothetical protein
VVVLKLNPLIQVKQAQLAVLEAEKSRVQAELANIEAEKSRELSNYVMLFTIVTIVFVRRLSARFSSQLTAMLLLP